MDEANYMSSEEEEDDGEEEDDDTEESSCETEDSEEDSSSQQTTYGANLANNDKLEQVCLGAARVALPQGLCENQAIFNEFFSMDTWRNVLTEQQREHLKQYLPSFPQNDEGEKAKTVHNLFARNNFKFGNPLDKLFTQLHSGHLRPDIFKMRALMKKAQYREYRYRQRRYCYRSMRALLVSRRRLLAAASSLPPDTPPRVERLIPPPRTSPAEQRARRRYFEELSVIRKSQGESSQSSEDEWYPEGPPPRLSKKQKKQLMAMELSLSPDLTPMPSTLTTSRTAPFQLESRVTCTFNPFEITEETYRALLMRHKKRRSHGEDHPELDISGINLNEVAQRSQTSRRTPCKPETTSQPRSKKKIKAEPVGTPPPPPLIFATPDLRHNSPSISEDSCSLGFPEAVEAGLDVADRPAGKVVAQRRSVPVLHIKEEVLDEEPEPPREATPPVTTPISYTLQNCELEAAVEAVERAMEVEETPSVSVTAKPELELTQETHTCFLSLVRDVICSTPDQRMGLPALEQRLKGWQESPISPLNDWYHLAPSWVSLLPSAVNFLSGDFPAETQPEDFVPYLEYKPHMQAYQWIGAGRDSDHHLAPLCSHWLERRSEVPAVPVREEEATEEPGLVSPPPPRCPTTWQARTALGPERDAFHQQEKRRYENPNRAFTYRMHGFESVVSPVKGAYALGSGLTKPRGHTLLVPERPNYVTILSLVRDAVARLPNGEGTRTDICELLRDSQYLSAGAEENYLQSVVGGALDRLHYEADTCVKYDTKRKMWVYLHRNRSEEEFEKLHQQQSVQTKTKRPAMPRKQSRAKAKDKEVKPVQVVASTLASVLAPGRLAEAPSLVSASPTLPSPMAPIKASPVATTVPRTFTLSSSALQNLQVATSSGIQTIQVSAASSLVGGTSLLATSAGQQVKLTAATAAKKTPVTTLTSTNLTPQTLAAARLMVSSSGTLTVNKSVSTMAQQTSLGPPVSSPLPTPISSAPLVLHPVSQQRTALPGTTGKTLLASVNASQLVNVSQMQLVNAARALQQQQIQLQQQQLQKQQQAQQQAQQQNQQQQAQPQTLQQQTQQVQHQVQQQVLQQVLQQQQTQQAQKQAQKQLQRQQQLQKKRQLQQQQQLQHQLQQKAVQQQHKQLFEQQLAQLQLDQATKTGATSAGVKLISTQAAVKSIAGGGSPMHGTQAIFIKHSGGLPVASTSSETVVVTSAPTLLLGKPGVAAARGLVSTTSTSLVTSRAGTIVTTAAGKPMVAKVLTNAQGQLISMESLLAHQKQQLAAAAAAGTVRMAGAKAGQQASLIQLPGTGGVPQYAMVTQGGLMGPRLLQAAAQQFSQHQAQQAGQQQAKTLTTSGLRMVTPGTTSAATGLNVATIGGQQVILASKAQGAMAGQNVFLASSAGGGPAVVLTSSGGLRTSQGGTLVLQPGAAQQIVLPHGFQGGTLNFKTLQSLQGIRVIPLAQATAAAAAAAANTSMPKGRQQVYARIITPPNRVAAPPPAPSTPAESSAPSNPEGTE